MWERVGRKVGIEKIESMETWKNKMGKYQQNWNYGKLGNYVLGKYQENWKYWNLEDIKEVNRNKSEALLEEDKRKNRKGIQWNKYYYYYYN